MKKLIGILVSFLILYIIYFDVTVGTLPHGGSEQVEAFVKPHNPDTPYFEAKVKPGDTLISIVEHQQQKSLTVPIDELIKDFKSLNQGQSPDHIQIGKSYKFPKYAK